MTPQPPLLGRRPTAAAHATPRAVSRAGIAVVAAALAIAVAGCASSPKTPAPPPFAETQSAREAARARRAEAYAAAIDPGRRAAITRERHPDADAVALYQWEQTRYETNGAYRTEWTEISKILTERALEDSSSIKLWNNDFYGSITVLVARVHSPDGSTRDIDLSENLAEAIDTSSLSSNIHDPADKTFTLAFPGLNVGDAIEVSIRRTVHRPRFEGFYSDLLCFEEENPVLWQGAEIEGPLELPFRSRAFRDGGGIVPDHAVETNLATRSIVETWIARDVAQCFGEPDMPPMHACTARQVLSTAQDWETLSRWYAKLCEPHLAATNAAMAQLVSELSAAAPNRDALVESLFDFVSRKVRYMGAMAESEAPGYEPHDVNLTFENRYGVCRDKAALLVSLLRMAGINAWPVLIHVGEKRDPDVPQLWFNHAIVAADSGEPDSPYTLMDPTSETTRSLLPEYLSEKSYLVARKEGDTLREAPPLPATENSCSAETSIRFGAGGTAFCNTTIRFAGIDDVRYRGHFASLSRDGVRVFCQRVLAIVAPGAALTGFSLTPDQAELRENRTPLKLEIQCETPGALRLQDTATSGTPEDGSELATVPFSPPRFAECLAFASHVVGELGLEKRRFPLLTETPCTFSDMIRFDRAPDPVPATSFKTDAIRYEDKLDGDTLRRSLMLLRSEFSPEQYATLRAMREADERADRAPLFFKVPRRELAPGDRPSPESISNALSRAVIPAPDDTLYTESVRVELDLSGLATNVWTETTELRRRVVTWAGQRKAADLEFSWQPDVADFELLDARTVLPDGSETPITPALDVFDAEQPWVANAPRYPAGRLKTVSFPKVQPGSTLVSRTRRTVHGADFFSYFRTMGFLSSFGEETLVVRGPAEIRNRITVRPPRWPGLAPFATVEKSETDDATVWTVRGGGPGSAVAQESNMPASERLLSLLEISDCTEFARALAIRDAMMERSDPLVETNAAALARSLASPDAGTAEKVRAIRDWSDLNLRPAGPSWHALPISALSHADETLSSRYGHYADRQILRLAMARALGLAPRFLFHESDWDVLVQDGETVRTDRRTASPSTFDSITFAFESPTGERWFLDGSSRYAPLPFDSDRDSPRLELPASGVPDSSTVLPPPPLAWEESDEGADATEIRFDIHLREDGSARVDVAERHRGSAAEIFRRNRSQMVPEERRRDAQGRAAAVAQSAKLVGDIEEELQPQGPCGLAFSVEVPDFAAVRGNTLAFRIQRESLHPETAPRRFPFSRTMKRRSRTVSRIFLPEGWTVRSMPPGGDVSLESPQFGISLRRETKCNTAAKDEPTLVVSDTLCLGHAEFGPELYPRFLSDELATRGAAAGTVVVEKKSADADSASGADAAD